MPEPQKPEGTGDPQTPEAGTTPDPKTPEAGTTFTQADVDRIVRDRLARAVPEDYEDAKAKAARLDALEEEQKTELQKEKDRADRAESAAKTVVETANARLLRAEITAEAAKQGGDTDIVVALLASKGELKVDKDGNVAGVADAVKALLTEKPHLKIGGGKGPQRSGGEFGGSGDPTIPEQISELEKKGDKESMAQARALKIRQTLEAQ